MDILINLGIEEKDIVEMINMCPEIKELTNEEIEEKIALLQSLGCKSNHIRNIVISNPFYLDRLNSDILNLIKSLRKINIEFFYLLFDSNPYLLNKDDFEIDEYIDNRTSKGMSLEDIKDELESNPYIIDEL